MIHPSEFVQRETGWYISVQSPLGIEIKVPDVGGAPSPAGVSVVNLFLDNREPIERYADEYLTHHLRFEGQSRLKGVHVLPVPDRHNASLLLIYHNAIDRYLWLEIGMSPHPVQHLTPVYALATYW